MKIQSLCHRLRPSAYRESGTTSCSGVESGVGSGEFRQTGQEALSLSHASTHITWKQCLQSGSILIISPSLYSHRQIAQTASFSQFPLRFVNTSFGYELITACSSPTTAFCSPPSSSSATKMMRGK